MILLRSPFFKNPKVLNNIQDQSQEIFFPIPVRHFDENAYNQMSIVLLLKLAAMSMHEFETQSLDEFFKIYEKVLVCCNNNNLLMMLMDISENLMMGPGNKMGIKVDLRNEKKQLLAQRVIKRTVRMTREEKNKLHPRMT